MVLFWVALCKFTAAFLKLCLNIWLWMDLDLFVIVSEWFHLTLQHTIPKLMSVYKTTSKIKPIR